MRRYTRNSEVLGLITVEGHLRRSEDGAQVSGVAEPPIGKRKGTFTDFLAHLLTFESGIDPARFDWYVRHFESPVVSYPRVTMPGRVVRDEETGEYRVDTLTVREYFETLGVVDLFDARSPECMRLMQYHATNAFGFIGYQIGEAILITNGYYQPECARRRVRGEEREYERYYFGSVEPAKWRSRCREVLYQIPSTAKTIIATDVNCWRGTFTGKNRLRTLGDLKIPEIQEAVIRDIIQGNYHSMQQELAQEGRTLGALLDQKHLFRLPGQAAAIPVDCTISGLLAAAHLCGASSVLESLRSGIPAIDEFGTSIGRYLAEFGYFDTPYDSSAGRTGAS